MVDRISELMRRFEDACEICAVPVTLVWVLSVILLVAATGLVVCLLREKKAVHVPAAAPDATQEELALISARAQRMFDKYFLRCAE